RLVGGDTVCIYGAQDGRAPGLKIRNFYNAPNLSESNPIRFINAGGQVVLGDNNTDTPVYVQNSRHLILSGTGVEGVTYGFLVDGENISSEGVKLSNRTSHIELDHWEISNVIKIGLHLRGHANCADASPPEGVSYRHVYDLDGDGFAQKGWILGYNFLNQPIYDPGDVDDVLTQNNFTIRNISIHHNYVHDTGTEGMYLGQNMVDHLYRHDGSRGPAMGSKITCRYKNPNLPNDYQPSKDNQDDPLNSRIDGIQVYNNRFENTGWDSINVKGGARRCAIYDNWITNYGWRARQNGDTDQTNGIDTTPNVHCDVYRNVLLGGGGSGIFLYGVGGTVAHNLIVEAGTGGESGGKKTTGIEIATPNTEEWDLTAWYQNDSFTVYNNTIVAPLTRAVRVKVPYSSHLLANNLALHTLEPVQGEPTDFKVTANVIVLNNLYRDDVWAPGLALEDPSQHNYRPTSNSKLLLDAGNDLTDEITSSPIFAVDLDKLPRVVGDHIDIGAYEGQWK
ncbi:MAG: hypothetical protein P8077_04825, partial [Gammaproteobacteria bacterium]